MLFIIDYLRNFYLLYVLQATFSGGWGGSAWHLLLSELETRHQNQYGERFETLANT